MVAKKKCANCGSTIIKEVKAKSKSFCSKECKEQYGSKKPKVCEFC